MAKIKYEGLYDDDKPANAVDKLTGGSGRKSPLPVKAEAKEPKPKQHRNVKQTPVYLFDEQQDKLDDLVYLYNKQHRDKKANRQDIIRYLIDQADITGIQDMKL